MNDRIKLAEAMGLDYFGAPPDPFTDANDDYAVLEWAREQWKGKTTGLVFKDRDRWHKFKLALTAGPLTWRDGAGYQIGDYARAVLKVIT